MEIGFLKIFLSLILVLVLIAMAAYILQFLSMHREKWPFKTGSTRLQFIESMSLDSKRRLVLIQHEQQQFLFFLSPHSDQIVDITLMNHEGLNDES